MGLNSVGGGEFPKEGNIAKNMKIIPPWIFLHLQLKCILIFLSIQISYSTSNYLNLNIYTPATFQYFHTTKYTHFTYSG